MKVLILFESMFGNTESLAGDVLDGLTDSGAETTMVEVGSADQADLDDFQLLVVAAPTHALSLSKLQSRIDAAARGADALRVKVGVRDWLAHLGETLPTEARRPATAVFDTRVVKSRHWPGSAASRAARILRSNDFTVIDRTSFYVEGIAGPLTAGEHERAYTWGRSLTSRAELVGAHGSRR